VAAADHDSVTRRARTGRTTKLACLAGAGLRAALSAVLPASATLHARPAPEVAFLVDAAARAAPRRPRSEALVALLAQLEAQDRGLSLDRLDRSRG
jgi:phytoene synthase